MNPKMSGALWAYALANLVACDDNFVPYNQVDGTRVLGIGAEPAELSPGRSARLSALVMGAETFRWSWCPVTLGPSAGQACALEEVEISTSSTAVLTWPTDAESLCNAAAAADAPQDGLRLDCQAERPAITVRLVVQGSGESVTALWPLVIGRPDRSPNQNPRLVEVQADGARLEDGAAMIPGRALPLTAVAAPDAAEAGESLKITWFVTGGEVERARTAYDPGGDPSTLETNTWTLPTSGADAALHLVIRDDRGGVSWLSRHFDLEGALR